MATNDASKVSVGKPKPAGSVWAGDKTITAPTDSTSELPAGLVSLGFVSDDGLTNSADTDSEEIKEWGGLTVLRVRTSYSETFKFTLIQSLSDDVIKEVRGADNYSNVGGVETVKHTNKELPHRLFVFEVLLNDGTIKRIVVPDAQITEMDDVEYKNNAAIGYNVTLSAYPNADGVTAFEYRALPAGS
jgi:hypothetical protein